MIEWILDAVLSGVGALVAVVRKKFRPPGFEDGAS